MVSTLHSDAGNSLCAFVHGFEPYFYVEAPPAFGPDDCDSLRAQLNVSHSYLLLAEWSLENQHLTTILNRADWWSAAKGEGPSCV